MELNFSVAYLAAHVRQVDNEDALLASLFDLPICGEEIRSPLVVSVARECKHLEVSRMPEHAKPDIANAGRHSGTKANHEVKRIQQSSARIGNPNKYLQRLSWTCQGNVA